MKIQVMYQNLLVGVHVYINKHFALQLIIMLSSFQTNRLELAAPKGCQLKKIIAIWILKTLGFL